MSWNPENYEKTLLLENLGSTKNPKYALTGFVRITKPTGESFLEPIPNDWYWKNMTFDSIQHVAALGTNRDDTAGELTLIRRTATGPFRGRQA